ncbi:MAG: single-stranded-DNA-specific exonuclease RecJ [Rhodothalassiaceae bacterium]
MSAGRPQDRAAALGIASSLSGRTWRLEEADERHARWLSQTFDLPEIAARVMAARGISAANAEAFLHPTLRGSLPDPSLLKDMDRAAERVAAAIVSGEETAVFGDYDVDGATSSALLARFFRALGRDLRIMIPDRIREGYGPNSPAMMRLAREGVRLVITVDCGTLAFAPLLDAKAAGLDVVVIDHHKAEPRLPEAFAVVNPNRLDDESGVRELAAVGVAFLLIIAVNRHLRRIGWYRDGRAEPALMDWLDLVALGTVADVVPLTGPNRALVAQGLKVMAARRNAGIAALSDVARLTGRPSVYHLGFLLGPRVNAGGRVGQAHLGARLLMTDDRAEADEIARQLDSHNAERRQLEQQATEEALLQLADMPEDDETAPPIVFVSARGWHQGVIGIVASRLVERFGRPAFVFAIDADGIAKGSARSIAGVDIGAAVIEALHAGLCQNGGGHAMAAGLTALAEDLGPLRDFLADRLAPRISKARYGRSLAIDAVLSVGGANLALVEGLERLAPFGAGNPAPRLALADARLLRADRVGENHVRCILGSADNARIKAVAFRAADEALGHALLTGAGRYFHVAGRLKRDDWGARPSVEMTIDDAAPARD